MRKIVKPTTAARPTAPKASPKPAPKPSLDSQANSILRGADPHDWRVDQIARLAENRRNDGKPINPALETEIKRKIGVVSDWHGKEGWKAEIPKGGIAPSDFAMLDRQNKQKPAPAAKPAPKPAPKPVAKAAPKKK